MEPMVVVEVRVPRRVKEVLEARGVDVETLVRRVLLEEAERLVSRDEELARLLDSLRERLGSRIDPGELARLVDEERGR